MRNSASKSPVPLSPYILAEDHCQRYQSTRYRIDTTVAAPLSPVKFAQGIRLPR